MPDDYFAPLGIPGNPLDGTPMGMEIFRPRKEKGTKRPLQTPSRLEPTGITSVGSTPGASQLPQSPEQLLVPDVVSATDPAFSMRPEVRLYLDGLSKVPSAQSDAGTPWAQWKGKNKHLRKSELESALGIMGLDLPYLQQGADPDV